MIAEITSDAPTDTKSVDAPFASGASRNLPSPGRLFLFAIILPVVVAASNQLVYDSLPNNPNLRSWLYPWMAATAAALSWATGRYLFPAWLRWLLFGWCLLLMDVLTIAACVGNRVDDSLGYLLIAAQVNLLTFYAIMGAERWQFRLPVVFVGTALILMFCYSISRSVSSAGWALTMILTAIVGGALCIGLRMLGFRLANALGASTRSGDLDEYQSHQFNLRHMFLWATAAVPLLLAVRTIDLLFFVPWLDVESAFATALLAASIAAINLVAIWCVLGAGWRLVRIMLLLTLPLLIASGLYAYGDYITKMHGPWSNVPILNAIIQMEDRWYSWLWLSAALLAALLLFLRASGYQLVRTQRVSK